jgi:hypothetical protein
MLPGETWNVLFWEIDSAKRRVALSGSSEAKNSCEQWSAAEAVAARAREEARFEERMSECGDQHDARWEWEEEWQWEESGCWRWFAGVVWKGDGRCFERRDRDRGDWARMAVTVDGTARMSGYEYAQVHARGSATTRPTRDLEVLRMIVVGEGVTLASVGDDQGRRRRQGI